MRRHALHLILAVAVIVLFAPLAESQPTKPGGQGRSPRTSPSSPPPPAGSATPPPPAAAAPSRAVAPAAPAASCVNSGCHSPMGQDRYVHGPVAAGACVQCHAPRAGVNHPSKPKKDDGDFEFTALGADLCYTCHERKNAMPVVHGPIQWGQCSFCHDPHQSPYPFRLKEPLPVSNLCYKCHQNDKTTEKEVHGPVAQGECTSCHDPHQGQKKFRLVRQGSDLCYGCHTEKEAEFTPKRFGHVPARLDCSNCHDPHNSPNASRIQRPVPELCFGCHPDKKQHIQTARTDHEAVRIEKKCLNCHDPHFTDYPKQLKKTPMHLCLGCHDKEQKATDGKMLINMKALLDEFKDWHGPIRQQDCAACHDPHGTDNFRILRRAYPRDFYAPFKPESYSLCFGCHEPTLALEPTTTTLTNFRNGSRNLHFVHVNKADKGRTCRACHEVHASHRPKHIREGVPFGGWEVKTNFSKYQVGGKCAPACHVPRGYSRKETVQNPIDYAKFTAD